MQAIDIYAVERLLNLCDDYGRDGKIAKTLLGQVKELLVRPDGWR